MAIDKNSTNPKTKLRRLTIPIDDQTMYDLKMIALKKRTTLIKIGKELIEGYVLKNKDQE